MFHIFSIFYLNLEITAPECSIPDISYKLKWFFIQALPLGAAAVFGLLHLSMLFYKRCIQCRKKNINRHFAAMVGMFFTMFCTFACGCLCLLVFACVCLGHVEGAALTPLPTPTRA